MGMPDLALNILLRIAILSQLGKKTEVGALIRSLRTNPSNKTWISKEYLSRFFSDGELVENLFKGLKSVKIPVLTVA